MSSVNGKDVHSNTARPSRLGPRLQEPVANPPCSAHPRTGATRNTRRTVVDEGKVVISDLCGATALGQALSSPDGAAARPAASFGLA